MKAIILAAGVGSRMGRLTEATPKCLLEINNQQVIRKQANSLKANGVFDISVVVGYQQEKVREATRDLGLKYYSNNKFKDTGMIESLYCAKEELSGDFLMIYGDIYFEKEVITRVLEDKNDFCMIVDRLKGIEYQSEQALERYHGEMIKKGSTKVTIKGGLVKKISKSLLPEETSAEYIGITKFSRQGAEIILRKIQELIKTGEIKKYPSPSYLIRWLIEKGEEIQVVFVEEKDYAELDYEKDVVQAKERFEK